MILLHYFTTSQLLLTNTKRGEGRGARGGSNNQRPAALQVDKEEFVKLLIEIFDQNL